MQQGYKPKGTAYVGVAGDDRNHPLHRVYRKRIRWVRMRWFTTGMILGAIAGILLTLGVSALVVTKIPSIVQSSGDSDVSVVIGESYLNRVAADRIKGSYSTGVDGLTLTGLHIDLKPDNRMDLAADFKVNALFVDLDANAAVKNQVAVQNDELVINMVGDPQLGNLSVPLDMLPFNLKDQVGSAVNQINNSLIIKEINDSLKTGFGGSDFTVQGATTTEDSLVIRLQHK